MRTAPELAQRVCHSTQHCACKHCQAARARHVDGDHRSCIAAVTRSHAHSLAALGQPLAQVATSSVAELSGLPRPMVVKEMRASCNIQSLSRLLTVIPGVLGARKPHAAPSLYKLEAAALQTPDGRECALPAPANSNTSSLDTSPLLLQTQRARLPPRLRRDAGHSPVPLPALWQLRHACTPTGLWLQGRTTGMAACCAPKSLFTKQESRVWRVLSAARLRGPAIVRPLVTFKLCCRLLPSTALLRVQEAGKIA